MILEGVTIHLQDYVLCTISKQFPQRNLELVEFQPSGEGFWRGVLQTTVDEDVPQLVTWLKDSADVDNITLLRCEKKDCMQECTRNAHCSIAFTTNTPPFATSLVKNSLFIQMPVILRDGTMYLKFVSTETGLKEFYLDLCKIEQCEVHIIKKFKQEEIGRTSLTEKQDKVLRVAIDLGYYQVPRTITLHEMAERIGMASSTLAEHLRKAEKSIICSYSP